MMPKKAHKLFRYALLSLITASILLISYLRLADNYELETLDLRFALRAHQAVTGKVVLIEIGDDTLGNLGRWPLDRNYHAALIRALSDAGARAIAFDIFFSEPREYDDELAESIRDAKNIYLPFVFDLEAKKNPAFATAKGYNAKNLDIFSAADRGEGHINILPDIDGKFRRIPLLISYRGGWYPYISFLVSCDYLGIPIKEVKMISGKYLICGKGIKVPLDDSSNMIINFSGRWGEVYKHYSYYDVLQSYLAPVSGQKPILDLSIFRDKVCIIGLTAAGTVDLHPNPFEPLYPGFGIHAEVFNSFINKKFISRASKEMNLALLIILSVFIMIVTLKSKPVRGFLILAAASTLFILAGILGFNIYGVWIDLFLPTAVLWALYLSLTLYRYAAEWKKRLILENELGIAKKIQESFLPKNLPKTEGLDIEAAMFTARQVGGDLYDFRIFEDGRLGVMIGDVSGKGVPASLFMAMVTSEFKFFAGPEAGPQDVLRDLNSKLANESTSNLFVTMFYMIFDMKEKICRYSNGAHLPVIHLNDAGEIQLLDVPEGTPLGLIDSAYGGKEFRFKKGDTFVLYTDGVTEAMNQKGEMYGEKAMISVIKNHRSLPSKGMLDAIEKDVRGFEPKSKQHDDMTLIVIKIT